MPNLQEYGLWLVLVAINAVIVSQWINYLALVSDEVGGLAAGLFLTIFLASSMFLLMRNVMPWLDRQLYERRCQTIKILKVKGVA